MRYLSMDIEATGLEDHDLIIELAFVPFDSVQHKIEESLAFHTYIWCPSFSELRPKLGQWVIEHNEELINTAHSKGEKLSAVKENVANYLQSPKMKDYFGKERITLFGKSMNAIDLPFLNRDFGRSFMQKHFHHRDLDLSSVSRGMIDLGMLGPEMSSGTELMRFLGFGEVQHTALADAINTARMYLELIKRFGRK